MHQWGRRAMLTALSAATVAALAPAAAGATTAPAGGASPAAAGVTWAKISTNTGLGLASAGLLRTADGKLHVIWPSKDGTTYSLHYSTVGAAEKLLATGTIVTKWQGVSAYPRLVPGPRGGLRLVFTGGNGVNGSPYNTGAMYTATATAAGTAWKLAAGSMSHSTLVSLTDTAAVTESDGTPVAAWPGGGLNYHVGIDPSDPAAAPDSLVAVNPGSVVVGPALARKPDGSVWAAWFTSSGKSDQGYWVAKLRPSQTAKVKAPGSGLSTANNQPLQPVAFTARTGGGLYFAYCAPSTTTLCPKIMLWKVGAGQAVAVPGSATGHATHVAIAAGPGGHLWILWYDSGLNKIRVVRTNAAATKFGPVQALPLPPKADQFNDLQAEGSQGPLDVLPLVMQNVSGSTPAYWDTQILPKLKLTGSPSTVSHTQATTVTFKVTDAGDPVPGATVKFLGKTATTGASGTAKITVPKGTATGSHTATASKPGYTGATFTVKVT